MCSKLVFLVVAVACMAAVAQAGGRGFKGLNPMLGGKSGNGSCHGFNFTAMISCCPTFPKFIKEKSVADCKATMKASEPAGGAPPPPPPAGGGGKFGGRWGKGENHRNRSCVMECAYKTEGLISTGADGKNTVDLAALNARLTALAVAPWDVAIKDAKANCTAAAPKIEGDQTCTSGAMVVTKCLFKYLMKSCPAPVNSTECADRMKKMAEMESKMEAFKAKFGKLA